MESRFPGFPSFSWFSSSSSSSSASGSVSGSATTAGSHRGDPAGVIIPIEDLAVKDKNIADVQHLPAPSSSSSSSFSSKMRRYWTPRRSSTTTRLGASTRKGSRGIKNFLKKFLLDQTIGSVVNVWLFIVLINLLKGKSWSYTSTRVSEDMPDVMIARLKYRPIVAGLMFTIIPVDRRVVFGSFCGVIWSVYLSLHSLSR
jgi:protein Mpv17